MTSDESFALYKEIDMFSHFYWIACSSSLLVFVMVLGKFARAEAPATGEASVVQANNQFAWELYGQLDKEKAGENLFFSPTSISLALSMTAAGAKGQTETEMAQVLHLTGILPAAHAANHALLERWNANDKDRGYQLSVANRLWGQKGYPILEDYLSLTRREYGAEMGVVDFARQTEAARQEINAWVENRTAEKIKNLIPAGAIDAATTLVLTNAIYFKGDWMSPFKKEATREEDFTVSAQRKVKLPMMQQKRFFPYMEDVSLQAVELPYKGGRLTILVLLPKKTDGLPELEKSLSTAKIEQVRSKIQSRETILSLPKFKLDASFSLGNSLKSLGMKSAFSPGADFSGIDGKKDLFISAVIHKAFVEVNETGTEAAAATAGIMTRAAMPTPTPPAVFRADHPFIFLICDRQAGSILFLGRMTNPHNEQ
jgi:serpin B